MELKERNPVGKVLIIFWFKDCEDGQNLESLSEVGVELRLSSECREVMMVMSVYVSELEFWGCHKNHKVIIVVSKTLELWFR